MNQWMDPDDSPLALQRPLPCRPFCFALEQENGDGDGRRDDDVVKM